MVLSYHWAFNVDNTIGFLYNTNTIIMNDFFMTCASELLFFFIYAVVISVCWNTFMTDVFNLPHITLFQAAALDVLYRLFVKRHHPQTEK